MNNDYLKLSVLVIIIAILTAIFLQMKEYKDTGIQCVSNPAIFMAQKTKEVNNAQSISCSCQIDTKGSVYFDDKKTWNDVSQPSLPFNFT